MDVCGMYRMPSLYDSSCNVVLPDCMYAMKSIYEPMKATPEGLPNGTVVDERLLELEKKQEEILHSLCRLTAKLKELKADVIYIPADVPTITSESKAVVHKVPEATPVVATKIDNSFVDVVMYASPSQPPPVSLLILYEWLRTRFSVHASCHVHSEITDVHPHLRDFFNAGNSQEHRACHQIALTLIWKEVEGDFLMMVNPFKQRHVAGEVNVVRYLSNIMAADVKCPDPVQATEIDSWLDVAHFSVVQGNSKERQAALRNLNSNLGKSSYLVGDKITAADVFMWSALIRCKLARDAPANVKKWMVECQKDAIFQSAVQFVEKYQM